MKGKILYLWSDSFFLSTNIRMRENRTMHNHKTEILQLKQRLVGLIYLAIAVLLPYWIFVGVGAIELGWEVFWHIIPLSIIGLLAYFVKRKIHFYKKQDEEHFCTK